MPHRPSRLTRFGLLRHAATEWNLAKRIQGHSDLPLCDRGRRDALAWGAHLGHLPWDRVVTSPLKRARETGALVNTCLGAPLMVDARLMEQSWGAWEGRALAWIEARLIRMTPGPLTEGWTFRPPDGESRRRVWRRSQAALVELSRRCPGETLLVVVHGGVLKALTYRLYRRRFMPQEKRLLQPNFLHWIFGDGRRLLPGPVNALDLTGSH
ncbi:MAG: histidine phosphatase family protein [Desulfosarcinaceae bacterium]|nr:histidine phosphatase family protein [Desulfosarcinaceae bacterium]